ncbi:MerR family transcriptional regulator [Cohnella xylanilytica]|uniref:MerR family transcriptional regulator n=1 Tax=Cohnella xylanilytica TaxID=557555 RepID=A0A841U3Y2_9BACL|nr:MerR family transcriptional regulator [Cohnella xylanilytica]MBB6692694.1 MerR family transcriptional regulator [Cohnella xylanilytica]
MSIPESAKGYRRYSESDIAWFEIIKYFRAMEMPIREMQQFLKIVDQMKELEKTLEKIDHKIDLFKNIEASEKTKKSCRESLQDFV